MPRSLPLLGPGAETLRELQQFSTDALRAVAENNGVSFRVRASRAELAHLILRHSYRERAARLYTSEDDPFPSLARDRFLLRLMKDLGVAHILDVGCGHGTMALQLRRILPAEGSYLGLDYVEPAISRARTLLAGDPRFRFEVGDAEEVQLPRGIDCVLLSLVVNFLDTHSADRLLQRLGRATQNTTLVVAVPFRGCVDRHPGVVEHKTRELAAARRYLRGDTGPAERIWDVQRFHCYRQSLTTSFKLVSEHVLPNARVVWVAKSQKR